MHTVVFALFLTFHANLGTTYEDSDGAQNVLDLTKSLQCEPIRVRMCRDMPYNLTFADLSIVNGYKNQDHQDYQTHAGNDLSYYVPLIQSRCSPYMNFVLCLQFLPLCSAKYEKPIRSCRELCETVKSSCEPPVKAFLHMPWPVQLDCSSLHPTGGKDLCVSEETAKVYFPVTTISTTKSPLPPDTMFSLEEPAVAAVLPNCPDSSIRLPAGSTQACVPLCDADVQFAKMDKSRLEMFMIVLTALGFLSTSMVILTTFVSWNRFQYPERPLIWIAVSFLFVMTGYFIRLFFSSRQTSCISDIDSAVSHLVYKSASGNGVCAAQFVLVHYFFHVGCLWWVILSLSWFLSTCRNWSPEGFTAFSKFSHVFAWIFPVILTAGIIIWHKVDANELSGMCGVGNFDRDALLLFGILPVLLYLVAGGVCAVAGFIGGLRIRAYFEPTSDSRFTFVLCRISGFSAVFIVSLSFLLSCGLYEYFNWTAGSSMNLPKIITPILYIPPLIPMFLAVVSGCWIFNGKTVDLWKRFCNTSAIHRTKQPVVVTTVRCASESVATPLFYTNCRTPWQSPVESSVGDTAVSSTWTHGCTGSAKV